MLLRPQFLLVSALFLVFSFVSGESQSLDDAFYETGPSDYEQFDDDFDAFYDALWGDWDESDDHRYEQDLAMSPAQSLLWMKDRWTLSNPKQSSKDHNK
ncbi:hypothetical protein HDV03_002450 [Kappamyces sp. JEL0829]|nr:hypothetical protein HDV03_002450 [Kappamyces sp. JEL0829]